MRERVFKEVPFIGLRLTQQTWEMTADFYRNSFRPVPEGF